MTEQRHTDEKAVDVFSAAMKEKLSKARDKGRAGWDDPEQCTVEHLAELFVEHAAKSNAGNFVDLANLAMMLHQRKAHPAVLTLAFTPEQGEKIERLRNNPAGKGVTGFALFDTSTEKRYIKKRRDGCLCFYEDEVDARLAKSRFEDTDYMAAKLISASKGEGND